MRTHMFPFRWGTGGKAMLDAKKMATMEAEV